MDRSADSYTRLVFLTEGPRVFAILLNYQNPGDTARCVASLRRSLDRDIHPLLVDNASGDSDRLRAELGPAVTVLENAQNLGYAAGNNVGIRHALERDADYIWILNPDTEVAPDTLQLMLAAMALRPDAGFVGSLNLLGDSDPTTIQFAGGHINWEAGAVTESVGLGQPLSTYRMRDAHRVDYVAGTSMLVRRGVFEDVGLLPEHYFLYFEETDLQVTAARRGWNSVLHPLARVWHHHGSARHLPAPHYTYYYIRGRILFAKGFTDLDDEMIEDGLVGFIDGWRSRVAARAPGWLDTYDHLVNLALADGKAGLTGYRADIHSIDRPS